MKILVKYLAFIGCLIITLPTFGQNNVEDILGLSSDEAGFRQHELNFGSRFHTNGYSAFLEKVWFKTYKKSRLLQIEYFHFKDMRERKQESLYSACNPKRFFFGKKNSFFALHTAMGQRRLLAQKADRLGVSISCDWLLGFSLGFEKPYYLEMIDDKDGDNLINCTKDHEPERYSESNASRFLARQEIYGASRIGLGFTEIKPVPGLHGKIGLHFDWATDASFVKALDAGISLDVYYRRLDVMVAETNKPIIFNLYLGFLLGKRY